MRETGRRHRAAALSALGGAALALAGCGSDTVTIELALTTGQETDVMARDPAVTRVDVSARAAEGDVEVQASAAPGGTFDLGELPADRLYTFEATGVDASGAAVVRGRSLSIALSALSAGSTTIPLFVQRAATWARPDGGLARAHVDAPAAAFAEQFLFTSGGTSARGAGGPEDAATSDFYDLLSLGGAVSDPMPRAARSVVARGAALLVVGDDGASWVDFDAGTVDAAALPEGLGSFADVAGGRVVEAADGVSVLVGATRAEGPTAAVLLVAADGALTATSLTAARAGAAATYVAGVGVVVAGGSATAPGLELYADGSNAFAARDFPPDAVTGAAAAPALAGAVVALVGGSDGADPAPTRTLDLACASGCTATAAEPALAAVARDATAYALPDGRLLVAGREAGENGATRTFAFALGDAEAAELVLREPRRGATPVPAPNGTLGIVGGLHPDGSPALSVELFFP